MYCANARALKLTTLYVVAVMRGAVSSRSNTRASGISRHRFGQGRILLTFVDHPVTLRCVSSGAEKQSEFGYSSWTWSVDNGFDLVVCGMQAISINDVPQVADTGLEEGTLGLLSSDAVLLEFQ